MVPATRRTLASRFKDFPHWIRWAWLIWAIALVTWIPVVGGAAAHHAHKPELITLGVIFGGAAVIATIVVGLLIGHRRSWRYLGWSILVGTLALGVVFWFAAAASQPSNGQDDPGAGLGAMFITVICVPPIAALLSLGGAIGAVGRRLR